MTDAPHNTPSAADDAIPTDAAGILNALVTSGKRVDSPGYSASAAALQERLKAGERVTECDRAAALGMSWPAYALIRGVQLARETGAIVHLDDDNGNPVIWIEIVAGVAEFRATDRRLIIGIGIGDIDSYLASWSPPIVH